MKIEKKILIILLSICSFIPLFGQNKKVDSLKIELKKAKHDTIRLRILDAMALAENDPKIGIGFNEQIETISNKNLETNPTNKNIYKKYLANAIHRKGLAYDDQGDIPKSLEYYFKSLKIREEIGDKRDMSKSLNNIGIIYKNQGDIPKALEYYNKCLKINEGLGDKKVIAISLTNIGIIYYNQGDIPKALEYYNKGLKYFEELDFKSGISYSLHNLGIIYANQGDLPKALEYNNKCLKINEELGDKSSISKALGNIGNIYLKQNDIPKALEYYNKSLKIKEELGDKSGISNSLINIGYIYLNKSETLKAFDCAKRAYSYAKETGNAERISESAKLLEEIYAKQGNYKLSRQFYGEYILMRDSLNNEENQKLTQQKYFQYQYEKKAATDSISHSKEMEIKNLEIGKQKSENRKQQIIIFSAIGGFLIVLFFSIMLLRMFRQKRKANIILAQQKEEISTQRDEIEAQRDLVTEQKEHIEEIHKEVTDSINYAKRIQEAVLPISDDARAVLGEHFILFKPKDIVSGDFYWTTKVNNFLFITVADCTGHGVPGAFMSMLGISFLTEIVNKQEITQASHVLNLLRIEIINALQQKGTSGEQKDGMDISLLVLNIDTNEYQWAGANNPIFIVTSDKELKVIEPDKMPVAIHDHMEDFTNHEIQLQKGDCIYLCSDGYEDQFGGPKNRKFMVKQLKELLVTISDKPMNEQHKTLNSTFENWRIEQEQIDDVTILGIKI